MRGTQDAIANGDTRSLTIRHMHTKEETTVTFRRDGRYVSEGLDKLNWALRDWRTDEPIRMDPRLFDLAWEVHRKVGSEQPFHVVSAYRSPGTNSMLRRRSRGVAKHSQHMLGKAMDFYLPDTPTVRIREAGMVMQRGGVGFYPGAHTPFVHLDAGTVRSWPRMTRDQLVRLFPDEKTVHLPADGQPLGNYEVAKAEILARGGAVAGYAAADLDEGAIISSGRKSLWAALFGGDEEEADARPTRGGRRTAPRPAPTVMAYARDSGSSDDGDRFATVREPVVQAEQPLIRERSQRLAPRPAAPEPQIAAAASAAPPQPAAAAVEDKRPRLIDAPIPLARPRGLTGPLSPEGAGTQVAALPGPAGAMAFQAATATDGKLVPAALPPRRPDGMGSPVETVIAGTPTQAPAPPLRPGALASLYSQGEAARAQPEGRLVTVTHPLPPVRQRSEAVALAAPPAGRAAGVAHTPIVAAYDADRTGLDSLFAAASRSGAPDRPVTVATARARSTSSGAATIQSPGPAASLGFSHADPNDAKPGSFSGPAVKPLPTNFVQN
ncbi:MAG: DUF882 domain-containing protein [Bosea sp. (in: a-proteobacteria)]